METTLNQIRNHTLVMCACGCGSIAPLVRRNNAALGHIKGKQHDFVSGHNKRMLAGIDMLMKNVEKGAEQSCWNWIGRLNRKGYGDVQIRGVKHNAHRAFYIEMGNSIPNGYHLDHLCRNKACVNPMHMEPVTPQENVRRQHAARAQEKRLRELCAEVERREKVCK